MKFFNSGENVKYPLKFRISNKVKVTSSKKYLLVNH